MLDQMKADGGIAINAEGIAKLASYATQQVNLEREIARLASEQARLAGDLKKLSEESIPSLMTELGVSKFVLTDGTEVNVKKFYSASLAQTNPNRDQAIKWLRDNGFADLVKNEVSATFGRGEDALAEAAVEALKKMGLTPSQDMSVHAQTLKAFIKEQVEAGKAIPLDLFKAYIGRKSTIDIPKEKK